MRDWRELLNYLKLCLKLQKTLVDITSLTSLSNIIDVKNVSNITKIRNDVKGIYIHQMKTELISKVIFKKLKNT